MTLDPTVAPEFAPVSELVRLEVWRLAKKVLPIECLAHLFGRPQMVRWTVDRVLERLAMGEGATHTLEALVDEERHRCPTGWDNGKPALRTAGSLPPGTFTPSTTAHGFGDFVPLGMFVQAEAEDGDWSYRQRTEDIRLGVRSSWAIDYIRYGG